MTAPQPQNTHRPGTIILFGSGELTPTGRNIHEEVFKRIPFTPPVKIGILETPTGFEVNAMHGWPERMENFFVAHLRDWKPEVTRIRAWRRDGINSTNDSRIVDVIREQQYLYSGAGSPSYVITHLRDTRAWRRIIDAHMRGTVLCVGSATAIAVGRFALPIYELYKAGQDLYWDDGLDIFKRYGIPLAVVPHWNNSEGEDFDTTRCWMGVKRFEHLCGMLSPGVTILGIDELTACVIDVSENMFEVLGKGEAHIIRGHHEQIVKVGQRSPLDILRM